MHPDVHRSTIYESQGMEETQAPINRQIDRDVMCVCMFACASIMEYCSAVRKKETAICHRADEPRESFA